MSAEPKNVRYAAVEPVLDEIINKIKFGEPNPYEPCLSDIKIENHSIASIANSFQYKPLKVSTQFYGDNTPRLDIIKERTDFILEATHPSINPNNPFTLENTDFSFLTPEYDSNKQLKINSKMKLLLYVILRHIIGTKKPLSIGSEVKKETPPEDTCLNGQVEASSSWVWEEHDLGHKFVAGKDPTPTDIEVGKTLLNKVKEINPLFHHMIEDRLQQIIFDRYYKNGILAQYALARDEALKALCEITGQIYYVDFSTFSVPSDYYKDEKKCHDYLLVECHPYSRPTICKIKKEGTNEEKYYCCWYDDHGDPTVTPLANIPALKNFTFPTNYQTSLTTLSPYENPEIYKEISTKRLRKKTSLIEKMRAPEPNIVVIDSQLETLEKLIELEDNSKKHNIKLWRDEDSPKKIKAKINEAKQTSAMAPPEVCNALFAITGSQFYVRLLSSTTNFEDFSSEAEIKAAMKLIFKDLQPPVLCRIQDSNPLIEDDRYYYYGSSITGDISLTRIEDQQCLHKLNIHADLLSAPQFILVSPIENGELFKEIDQLHYFKNIYDLIRIDPIKNIELINEKLGVLKKLRELENKQKQSGEQFRYIWPEKHLPSELYTKMTEELRIALTTKYNALIDQARTTLEKVKSEEILKQAKSNEIDTANKTLHTEEASKVFKNLTNLFENIEKYLYVREAAPLTTLQKTAFIKKNAARQKIEDIHNFQTGILEKLNREKNEEEKQRILQEIKKILLEDEEKSKNLQYLLEHNPVYKNIKNALLNEIRLEQDMSYQCFNDLLEKWESELQELGIPEYFLKKNETFFANCINGLHELDDSKHAKAEKLYKKHCVISTIKVSLQRAAHKNFAELIESRKRSLELIHQPETQKILNEETDAASKKLLYLGIFFITAGLGSPFLMFHSKKTTGSYNFFKAIGKTSGKAKTEEAFKLMGAEIEINQTYDERDKKRNAPRIPSAFKVGRVGAIN